MIIIDKPLGKLAIHFYLQLAFCFVASALASQTLAANNLLHVQGQYLHDEQGERVTLLGFGLGGWLMPEGYMLGFPSPYDSPRGIRQAVENLTDKKFSDQFFERYEDVYVTKKDLAAIKRWGFNSLRLPFNANQLLPDLQGQRELKLDPQALKRIDDLVRWASELGLYVILDMHAAPGGQSKHNIADAVDGAQLWLKPEVYWPQAIAIWQQLARRYNDEPWVIGYDLLNEPMVPGSEELGGNKLKEHDNSKLLRFYRDTTRAIRSVDQGKKILFIEGGFWAQNLYQLMPPWDDNMVYAFHAYPAPGEVENLPEAVALAYAKGYPLWFGEGGENYAKLPWHAWLAHNSKFTKMLEQHTIGWSWWTTKKMARATQLWHCDLPQGFDQLRLYLQGFAPKPSTSSSKKILQQYVKNLKTSNCHFLPQVVESLGGNLRK